MAPSLSAVRRRISLAICYLKSRRYVLFHQPATSRMQSLLPDRLASLKLDIQSTDASSPRAVAKLQHLPFLDGIVSKAIKKTKSENQELSIRKFLTLPGGLYRPEQLANKIFQHVNCVSEV